MPPAKKPAAKKVKERSVRRADKKDGKVTVTIERSNIRVAWLCGQARTFAPDDLREAIDYVNGLGEKYKPIWLNLSDSNAITFYVCLKDGRLTAAENNVDNGFVTWTDLQKALVAALEDVSLPADPPESTAGSTAESTAESETS